MTAYKAVTVGDVFAGHNGVADVLFDGDRTTMARCAARAATLVADLTPNQVAEAVDIARTAQRLGLTAAELGRFADIAKAADPVAQLVAWLDKEQRPRMRRALTAAVVAAANAEADNRQ